MNEQACPFCSGPNAPVQHTGVCPKVREIEYYENGRVKRVVFRGPNDWWHEWTRPVEPLKPWPITVTSPTTVPAAPPYWQPPINEGTWKPMVAPPYVIGDAPGSFGTISVTNPTTGLTTTVRTMPSGVNSGTATLKSTDQVTPTGTQRHELEHD